MHQDEKPTQLLPEMKRDISQANTIQLERRNDTGDSNSRSFPKFCYVIPVIT